MRIGHHGYEIQLHHGRDAWLWVVFDEDGDQLRSGHAPNRLAALGQARRTVTWRRSPVGAMVERLLSMAPHGA